MEKKKRTSVIDPRPKEGQKQDSISRDISAVVDRILISPCLFFPELAIYNYASPATRDWRLVQESWNFNCKTVTRYVTLRYHKFFR